MTTSIVLVIKKTEMKKSDQKYLEYPARIGFANLEHGLKASVTTSQEQGLHAIPPPSIMPLNLVVLKMEKKRKSMVSFSFFDLSRTSTAIPLWHNLFVLMIASSLLCVGLCVQ